MFYHVKIVCYQDPRGCLRGTQARDKRAKLVGRMGIVGPRDKKGGILSPMGNTN